MFSTLKMPSPVGKSPKRLRVVSISNGVWGGFCAQLVKSLAFPSPTDYMLTLFNLSFSFEVYYMHSFKMINTIPLFISITIFCVRLSVDWVCQLEKSHCLEPHCLKSCFMLPGYETNAGILQVTFHHQKFEAPWEASPKERNCKQLRSLIDIPNQGHA